MNWDALGAIGELIGGIVVIVSLAYLSFQVKASARETRANTVNAVMSLSIQSRRLMLEPQIIEMLAKVARGEELSPEEQLRREFLFQHQTNLFDLAHHHYVHGRLDDDVWKAYEWRIGGIFDSEWSRQYWYESNRSALTEKFRDYVESTLDAKAQLSTAQV